MENPWSKTAYLQMLPCSETDKISKMADATPTSRHLAKGNIWLIFWQTKQTLPERLRRQICGTPSILNLRANIFGARPVTFFALELSICCFRTSVKYKSSPKSWDLMTFNKICRSPNPGNYQYSAAFWSRLDIVYRPGEGMPPEWRSWLYEQWNQCEQCAFILINVFKTLP